ncbi:unnamed protein product [Cercospora beticola]|nr:unnamed protein product [Cercospora beticola]
MLASWHSIAVSDAAQDSDSRVQGVTREQMSIESRTLVPVEFEGRARTGSQQTICRCHTTNPGSGSTYADTSAMLPARLRRATGIYMLRRCWWMRGGWEAGGR